MGLLQGRGHLAANVGGRFVQGYDRKEREDVAARQMLILLDSSSTPDGMCRWVLVYLVQMVRVTLGSVFRYSWRRCDGVRRESDSK